MLYNKKTCETCYYILDFKLLPILNVVLFLFGDSLASEFYVLMFQNTLSVPSS